MAIPSGSGTEVLKVHYLRTVTNSAQLLQPTTEANHIYTILSIVVTDEGGNAEQFYIYRTTGADGDMTRILHTQDISANGTFVWNDKFVLSGTDKLKIETTNSANLHVMTSYIEQDWS